MFNFFRKSKDTHKSEVTLLSNIFNQMPDKFGFISKQLEEGIIANIVRSDKPVRNFRKVSYNVNLLNKYEDKMGKYFKIKGIKVFDLNTNTYTDIVIHIGFGILLGYYTPLIERFNPDVNRFDVSNFFIEYFANEDYDTISKLLNQDELKLINSADVYQIELNGKTYYHLKDLEDGDFIGMDTDKKIYKITHDPFEIIELVRKLSEVL